MQLTTQFSGVECHTVKKLHIYDLILFGLVMWFHVLHVFLSAKWQWGRKATFTSESCVFDIYEGTPQAGKFPCTSVVLLPLPHKIWTIFKLNEKWKRFNCDKFCLSLEIFCMTLAGNNPCLGVFLGSPKFI